MRLMNPGLGEMLDRLSILELKLAHGGGEQFAKERKALLEHLWHESGPVQPPEQLGLSFDSFKAYATLAAVNAALWQSEDALRAEREWMHSTVAESSNREAVARSAFLAHKIQALNDRRAELVREIGKLAGEEEHREKLSGGQS